MIKEEFFKKFKIQKTDDDVFYFNYKLEGLWFGILIINYLSVITFLFIVNNRMKSLGLEIFKKK